MKTSIPTPGWARGMALGFLTAALLMAAPRGPDAETTQQPAPETYIPAMAREYAVTPSHQGAVKRDIPETYAVHTTERSSRDRALIRRVERALRFHSAIRVDANKGIVILDGMVADLREREEILLATRSVHGVKEVDMNRLHVKNK